MRSAARTDRDSTDEINAIYVRFQLRQFLPRLLARRHSWFLKMTVICIEFRAAAEVQPRQDGWSAAGKTVGNRK